MGNTNTTQSFFSDLRGTKACVDCLEIKHLSKFHREHASPDGRQECCKSCLTGRYRNYGRQLEVAG